MAVLNQDPTQQGLSPDEVRRRQLMASMFGTQPAPAQTPSALSAPTATPPSQDNSSANTSTPPPAKPLSQSPQEQYAAQRSQFETAHPEAAGKPPTGPFIGTDTSGEPSFQQPSLRNRLLHGLFYGMEEFGRPGQGIKSSEDWLNEQAREREAVRNWPMQRQQNVETAFGKELTGEEQAAKTQQAAAAAQEQIFKTENPALETQLAEATRTGNKGQADVVLDMLSREAVAKNPLVKMAPAEMREAMLANMNNPAIHDANGGWNYQALDEWNNNRKQVNKVPPAIASQIGPRPTGTQWGPPGQPPKEFGTPDAAQAAWGQAAQALQLAGDTKIVQKTGADGQQHHVLVHGPTGIEIQDLGPYQPALNPTQGIKDVLVADPKNPQRMMVTSLSDAQQNKYEIRGEAKDTKTYDQNKINLDIMDDAVKSMKQNLSDFDALTQKDKTIMTEFLNGMPAQGGGLGVVPGSLMASFNNFVTSEKAQTLTEPARNVLRQIVNLRESSLGLGKLETGGSRATGQAIEAINSVLPGRWLTNSKDAEQQLRMFADRLDTIKSDTPLRKGAEFKENAFAKPQAKAGGHSFTVNGKQYAGVSDEDYTKAKKLPGFKE